jgi:ATP-binding protein involved in chromosome partitioning
MGDPRTSIITERLSKINRIIAVSSGKGGVGKSMVATTLALTLAQNNCKVGLFDLDFTSPSTHVILAAQNCVPEEDKGLVPPTVDGLEYMSLIYFVGDNPAPLRGAEVSNALIELLAVTQWGALDFLIIDMPPGIGDVILDLVRLVERIEFLIVTTPSLLAFETVKKQAGLLRELKMPLIGVLENMKMDVSEGVALETKKLGLKYLGAIPYDPQVEGAIGDKTQLLNTAIAKKLSHVIKSTIIIKRENPDGMC